jgi:single-stranded-DNA-specific exonuclease
MIWDKQPLDRDAVRDLASKYGFNLITASILVRRGITDPEELHFFLEEDIRCLHNPFLFTEMEDAVDRILAAREEGEKVLVFGDRDVDGITSTVLLVKALAALGIDAEWRLPMGDDPYGLTLEAVEEFAARDGTLIITVDCGISNVKEILRGLELGVDTIIVDHHNPPDEIPRACAVINPKLEDSGYPFRDLAGCGVVAKLVWALRFAETEFYNEPITLLNVKPGNGTFVLEAVRMMNLVVLETLTENLVPGIVAVDQTRLLKFFGGRILVYDAKPQEEMLRRIFGRDAEISLIDTAPEIYKLFPSLKGKSLLRLRESSRQGKYGEAAPGELDVFTRLFTAWLTKKETKLSEGYASCLDLVAIGTLADLMPLKNENRIFVKAGLKILNGSAREGLRELLRNLNLAGKPLSSRDVAWQIGPAINAAGRMGAPDKAARLLLEDRPEERERLAAEIVEMNRLRKKRGDERWDTILPGAKESFEKNGGKFVLVCDPGVERGITGILAARLVNFFSVPSAACAVLEDKVVGSLRSTRGYGALHFLERCSDLFRDYGGHDFAAGFNLLKEDLPRFEARVRDILPEIKLSEETEETAVIDAEIPPAFLKPEIEETLDFFAPYGELNPPLTFLTRGAAVSSVDFVGKKEQVHTKLLIKAGDFSWPAVFWNSAERVGRDFGLNDKVSIVYQIGKNYFQNKETLQLTILDIKKDP